MFWQKSECWRRERFWGLLARKKLINHHRITCIHFIWSWATYWTYSNQSKQSSKNAISSKSRQKNNGYIPSWQNDKRSLAFLSFSCLTKNGDTRNAKESLITGCCLRHHHTITGALFSFTYDGSLRTACHFVLRSFTTWYESFYKQK